MELKDYQKDVLKDLSSYLSFLRLSGGKADKAFNDFWHEKSIRLSSAKGSLHPYCDKVNGTPNVTVKVPTAGGKTFIACNAIDTIFKGLVDRKGPKVVVWAVPSDTILTQTVKNLKNPRHPYRETIDSKFNHAVKVVEKEDGLMGNGISPVELESQLTIFVISVQSFVDIVRKKKGNASYQNLSRVYRQDSALAFYTEYFKKDNVKIDNADESSLIQYIAYLNPVMIIDESHNFESMKRTDLLQNLNPAFIFDLTATPRKDSNIISFVDAMRLKKRNMVKLPVIIYNKYDKNGVIDQALDLRNSLERIANEEHRQGGEYLRPIVLFQAEPKNDEDTETFEKIRKALIEQAKIPAEQIKVKVSGHNELEGVDLMSETCPVRYIITVNALKEGWDCPFAYILATVANRSSSVDVEQILGRILRQPHTKPFNNRLLNMCYVLTCSEKFNETLQKIVKSMQLSGYSGKDYRVAGDENDEEGQRKHVGEELQQPTLSFGENEENEDFDISTPSDSGDSLSNSQLLNKAKAQGEKFDQQQNEEEHNNNGIPKEEADNMSFYPMIDRYKDDANNIILKNLYLKSPFISFYDKLTEVSMSNLLEGFDLSKQESDINLLDETDIASVDLTERNKGEYVATFHNLDEAQAEWLKSRIDTATDEDKCISLASDIAKYLSDHDDTITQPQYTKYVKNVLERYDRDTLKGFVDRITSIEGKFKKYIYQLKCNYVSRQFDKQIDSGRIVIDGEWKFNDKISFADKPIVGLDKTLYTEEQGVNPFEMLVITKISQIDNVLFWHRNQANNQGFRINGYIQGHYPDFIVQTKNRHTVLVETKGPQLANDDSKYRLKIGKAWEKLSGQNYRYFMVFPNGGIKLDDSLYVDDLIDILKVL